MVRFRRRPRIYGLVVSAWLYTRIILLFHGDIGAFRWCPSVATARHSRIARLCARVPTTPSGFRLLARCFSRRSFCGRLSLLLGVFLRELLITALRTSMALREERLVTSVLGKMKTIVQMGGLAVFFGSG